MKSFTYSVPTPIYFGKGIVKEKAAVITGYGKRAYIITDEFYEDCPNYGLQDVEAVLKGAGIPYAVNDQVEENPSVESCREIYEAAQTWNPDFLIAIGGGSALDTAKAVNVLFEYPEKDAYEVFFENKANFYALTGSAGAMPLIGIPTTAGTGSEVTPGSVMTRNDIHTKVNIKHKLFCTAAFLDSRYVKEAPTFLIHTGVLDALAHAMESYVNVGSSWVSRKVGAMEFELFSDYKDRMLSETLKDEDYDKMLLGSSLAGCAMMQAGTTLPNGLGYPLSHYHNVSHGLSCSITLGEYMRSFQDQTFVQKIVRMCGFRDVEDMCAYFAEIIKRDLHIKVTRREIDEWTDFFWENEQDNRLKRTPEPVTKEEIRWIYLNSLAPYMTDEK